MANTFINPTVIAKEALRILKNQLVMGALVHRDYAREFQKGKGVSVTVRKPAVFTAQEFSGSISVQDATEGSVTATLDHHFDVSFLMTAQDYNCRLDDISSRLIAPAVAAIAQAIDLHLCERYKAFGRVYGTAGTTPDTLDDIFGVRAELVKEKCPRADRFLVLDPAAAAKLGPVIAMAEAARQDAPATDALREAHLGRVAGFQIFEDQNIAYHTTGGVGTPLIDNAGTAYAAGDTAIHVDGMTTKYSAGDVFTLAHGGAVGTVGYAVKTASDLAGTDSDLTLQYGLRHATGAANDNALTTIASHRANMAFHKSAIGLVCRPLEKPEGAAKAMWVDDEDSGLALRVVFGYDMDSKSDKCSIDCLVGFVDLYPELGARLLG